MKTKINGRVINTGNCIDGLCLLGKTVDGVDYAYTYKCSDETAEIAENKIDEYIENLRRKNNAVQERK